MHLDKTHKSALLITHRQGTSTEFQRFLSLDFGILKVILELVGVATLGITFKVDGDGRILGGGDLDCRIISHFWDGKVNVLLALGSNILTGGLNCFIRAVRTFVGVCTLAGSYLIASAMGTALVHHGTHLIN